MLVRDVFRGREAWADALSDFEERAGQLQMAEAVESALQTERALLVEAGTGTGKTLAYLIPAILSGKKVVISTATRALQEQLALKDVPLARKLLEPLGVRFTATMMKGLSNYVCLRRLQEALSSDNGASESLTRVLEWVARTGTGDRAELEGGAEDEELWRRITSGTDTRIGVGCRHYEACFVTRMRLRAEEAQVVIVNHHLFFADLALRSGPRGAFASAICNYDHVIFDEAHQLEDIVTDFFGTEVSSGRIDALAADLPRARIERSFGDTLSEASRVAFSALAGPSSERRTLVPNDWNRAEGAVAKLENVLEVVSLRALEAGGDEAQSESSIQVARRASEVLSDLRSMRRVTHEAKGESIAWIEKRAKSFVVGASPIDVASILKERLFDRVPGVVMTSATLTSGPDRRGNFAYVRERLGVPPEADELHLPSPFDYQRQVLLYAPSNLPEPGGADFEKEAAVRAGDLIRLCGGGAFVLCTSTKHMHALAARLRKELTYLVLVQGEAGKQELLARFRADGNAVLVATLSFWEGVDVPGYALRLVVMDKIPFPVPSDPLFALRSQRAEAEGKSAFTKLALPAAAIVLKQGFGRLIRSARDEGVVAILDSRLRTRGYGRALLSALPSARRTAELDDVASFWAARGSQAGGVSC
ncbi:MAG: ATP-dependent DNA helicase [Polyangiaceae bacterium]